jgi:hypothetical protein
MPIVILRVIYIRIIRFEFLLDQLQVLQIFLSFEAGCSYDSFVYVWPMVQ